MRAVLAVSPNNPTGSVLSAEEIDDARRSLCRERRAALIVDEVFADYGLDAGSHRSELAADGTLVFRLGGLSKSAGLPQVKLGWILIDGPDDVAREALSGWK